MTSSTSSTLLCPVCSGENPLDSRFCRHCGHTLVSASAESNPIVTSPVESAAVPVAAVPVAVPAVAATGDGAEENEALSSPGEIDGRRARQLLDRAQYLSERGDLGGAILACRQSIALAPAELNGHSMLGMLLERSGDIPQAVAAYEKAVQLEPESPLERDNLARVREKLQESKSDTRFQFNDEELFADTIPGKPNDVVERTEGKRGSAPKPVKEGDYSLNVQQPVASGAVPVIPKIAPPVIFERRQSQRRRFNTPITLERRSGLDRRAVVTTVAPVVPVVAPAVATVPVLQAPVAVAPVNPWAGLWSRPSYFGRSLPLAGVTVLGLALLSWARGSAIARAVDAQMKSAVALAPTDSIMPATPPIINPSTGLPPLAPVGAAQPEGGGFPISNRQAPAPQARAANPASPATTNSASANGQRLARSPRSIASNRVTAPNRAPRFSRLIPPAVIPPARISANSGGSRNSNSDPLTLPAPNIAVPAPAAPPVSVLPAGGSSPLNPAGSSGRGYVRITQGRIGSSALPQRPSAQSNNDERSAANAARNGQNDQAIDRLTASINASSNDAGFRYQQRATLFLNRGDYSRAADDFQAAISAYNAQIDRGEQVAEARAGLRAARSGLNLALSGNR